jgi:hypothetical protein
MNFRIPLSSSIITFRSELSDLKIRDDKGSGSVRESGVSRNVSGLRRSLVRTASSRLGIVLSRGLT